MKRKVLICGATGFIGRNLTEYLSNRSDLEIHAVAFSRPSYEVSNVTWHTCDLRQASDVEALLDGVDVVIQAAATTSGSKDIITQPYIHVTDNAVMNSLLLRAAYDEGVSNFIFFSCTVMHQSNERALSEDDWDANAEMNERYFGVGWTKVYIEKMCEFFSQLGKTKHTVIRHSNIYGPYDKFDLEKSHVFGATMTKVMSNEDGIISVWGDGQEARDLLYVADLCELVEASIDKQESSYELVNAGAGYAVTIADLVQKIIDASGKSLSIEYDLSKPTIKTSLHLDCTKAKSLFGWEPKTSLEEGIRKTVSYWTKNIGRNG